MRLASQQRLADSHVLSDVSQKTLSDMHPVMYISWQFTRCERVGEKEKEKK